MMLLKPVCVKCQCFYRPEHNGHFFMEMMPSGIEDPDFDDMEGTISRSEAKRGTKAPHLWEPYKVWCGDLWKCPECSHEIVVGVMGGPISEHYMPDFEYEVTRLGASQLKVNDC